MSIFLIFCVSACIHKAILLHTKEWLLSQGKALMTSFELQAKLAFLPSHNTIFTWKHDW